MDAGSASIAAGGLTASALALLAFCVASETTQQLCFKIGVDRAGEGARSALLQPLVWIGVVIWIVEALAWMRVLVGVPLSVAYPVMTLTYVGVPIAGVLLLKEKLSLRQALGAAFVAAGVACVALAGGDA